MSKKIFHSVSVLALSILFASLVVILGVTYSYFSSVFLRQLKIETELAARGVELCGLSYLEQAEHEEHRITWIAADGSILYDNEADSLAMENHLAREEVAAALQNGYGESDRYSKTLSERQFYVAELLSDGTILRLAGTQSSIWTLFFGFGQHISAVILLALFLSLIIASRLAKKIVEPINRIDPDAPLDYLENEEYEEIEPLLRRMSVQQADIRRSQSELEKASQIRQEFTANASHELKTPLHTILGYAELLDNNMVKAEDIPLFAGKIRREAQRLTQLVEDIIDLSLLDSGAGELQRQELDLFHIAKNAVDSVQFYAEEQQVALTLQGESARMNGIPQILYSMIYNLCDNAIKYNHSGGKAEISVHDEGDAVKLCVSDTGIGIPPEYQSRIFERFFRVDKSHSREIGGTGLGLSIVKHGALIHGAKITVESIVRYGSSFTILFPKKSSDAFSLPVEK